MVEIPDSHPRKRSLASRQKIVDGKAKGILADSAMIAHGRGEAFDYLLGEKTTDSARLAIKEAAMRLKRAKNPVISVNGNTVVLAGKELIRVAAVLSCPVEVNLYYRTPERVTKLLSTLSRYKKVVAREQKPEGFDGEWIAAVESVELLGENPDTQIEGLEGPRALCTLRGIGECDTILVPLEDGDRCEALVRSGKEVIVVDLNPISRSSIGATVTIVDEISRASVILLKEILCEGVNSGTWDNNEVLRRALSTIADSVNTI